MKCGEAATFFGVVLQGTLAIHTGATKVLRYPGHLLGEMALFNGGLRNADCMATSDGVVAVMTFQQLEALKVHREAHYRLVAERLNTLLARCTLRKNLAKEQGLDESRVDTSAFDEPAALAELFQQQRQQNWANPKAASQLEAEALYRRAQQSRPPKHATAIGGTPLAKLSRNPREPPPPSHSAGGSGGYGLTADGLRTPASNASGAGAAPHGVVLQGMLQLALSKSNGPPSHPAWDKYWCVLTGSCLYLYTSAQQRASTGLVALSADSVLKLSAQRHGQAADVASFHLKHVECLVGQGRYKSVLLCADSRAETQHWARRIAVQQTEPFAHDPPMQARQAALRDHDAARTPHSTGGGRGHAGALVARGAALTGVGGHERELNASSLRAELGLATGDALDMSWAAYTHASRATLSRLQAVEQPFGDELEEGLTVWMHTRRTLRRVPLPAAVSQSKGPARHRLTLRSERAYLLLHAAPMGQSLDGRRRPRLVPNARLGARAPWRNARPSCDSTPRACGACRRPLLRARPLLPAQWPRAVRQPTPRVLPRGTGDQLRVELHCWMGSQSSSDAQGAVAIFAIHLQQLLEGEARLHREDEGDESELFCSYFAGGKEAIHVAPSAAEAAADARAGALRQRRQSRCCLWPPLPAAGKAVLYHIASASAPPSRIDATTTAISGRLLDEAGGAFVLDVTDPDDCFDPAGQGGEFGTFARAVTARARGPVPAPPAPTPPCPRSRVYARARTPARPALD